jgi:hypothetical protein
VRQGYPHSPQDPLSNPAVLSQLRAKRANSQYCHYRDRLDFFAEKFGRDVSGERILKRWDSDFYPSPARPFADPVIILALIWHCLGL